MCLTHWAMTREWRSPTRDCFMDYQINNHQTNRFEKRPNIKQTCE